MKMQTFTLKPMHHFTLKMPGHPASERFPFDGIKVQTDFPLKRQNSKAYREELQAHVKRVEADAARPPKAKTVFCESPRGKRRR